MIDFQQNDRLGWQKLRLGNGRYRAKRSFIRKQRLVTDSG